jgi:chromate reductase
MVGKPVAIASVSAGLAGGLRAQYELRKVLLYFRVHDMGLPELAISQNYMKFDKFKESK